MQGRCQRFESANLHKNRKKNLRVGLDKPMCMVYTIPFTRMETKFYLETVSVTVW